MNVSTKSRGDAAEQIARQYLEKQGYTILDTGWRYKKKEIDIICAWGDLVVFVEVKSRLSNAFGEPEMAVTRRKQGFLIMAANHYLVERDIKAEARFDVISITGDYSAFELNHIQGAFSPVAR